MALTLSLVLVTGLALAFETTRPLGLVGFGLLCLLHPVAVPVVLLLGSAAFLFLNHLQRSRHEP